MSPSFFRLASTAILTLCCVAAAHADRSYAAPPNANYQQECAACHVAYPPGLLPAASWQRIMGNLGKHFGTDASLDATTTRDISTWLTTNQGTGRRGGEAAVQDRITQTSWFVRKHDEVSASTWKRAAIGSPSNCAACHAQAAQGDFNEHAVRIPK